MPIAAETAPPGWEPANEDEAQEIDPVPPEWRAQHPQEEGESKENED